MSSEASAVQPWEIADLSLATLLRHGNGVSRSACSREVRVAILGDCATQHYAQALAATLKLRGLWPHMYEADFDLVRQEVLDSTSGLYAHRPDVIVLFNCLQMAEHRFHANRETETFAESLTRDVTDVWDHILKTTEARILQHNFCLPLDRPFGNLTVAVSASLSAQLQKTNAALAEQSNHRAQVRLIDTEYQASYFGRAQWLDERLWCHAKQALSPRFLPPLAKVVSDAIALEFGVTVKCLALDLDGTLWGGILGEAGPEGIELGHAGVGLAYRRFQEFLKTLKDRGILLAICSKNDEAAVRRVLREHPDMVLREDDFAAFEVHFGTKAESLAKLGERLNIGLDSFVFLDDLPFERDFVRTTLSAVQVPSMPEDVAEMRSALARWNLFEAASLTTEDVRRAELYRTDTVRASMREAAKDVASYLHSLEMEAEMLAFDAASLPRISQLLQRTNQFNLTTRRHSEVVLRTFSESPEVTAFAVRLYDRLGDNGIVAAAIARRVHLDLIIDTWVMSCRVLGRKVEDLTLETLIGRARQTGCSRLIGEYLPSPKNAMVRDLYARLGFSALPSVGELRRFALDITASREPPDIPIRVRLTSDKE